METRKERFSKYREQIKLTPDDQFPSSYRTSGLDSADIDLLSSVDKPATAISYGSLLQPLEGRLDSPRSANVSPYMSYLKGKRRAWIIKLSLFAVALAGMIIWFFLLQRSF
jgi:hypothetical protein